MALALPQNTIFLNLSRLVSVSLSRPAAAIIHRLYSKSSDHNDNKDEQTATCGDKKWKTFNDKIGNGDGEGENLKKKLSKEVGGKPIDEDKGMDVNRRPIDEEKPSSL
ncbi:uncharacterized protein LOC127249513 [Andrographis paniculata]|uniref:uncharacterized protein LOC127249513 n=1 Tax=Andrographis paniculata TaxID=175694 RepID=UPI0021E991BC|nr:uncharacterized protein LOC127249513 [Andrographis paniculata]